VAAAGQFKTPIVDRARPGNLPADYVIRLAFFAVPNRATLALAREHPAHLSNTLPALS
jgi:hypothetical protein